MTAATPRYLVENHGSDLEIIKATFSSATKICAEVGISEITLLVPKKGGFASTDVGRFLDTIVPQATRQLCNGKPITINSIRMSLESVASFSPVPYKLKDFRDEMRR